MYIEIFNKKELIELTQEMKLQAYMVKGITYLSRGKIIGKIVRKYDSKGYYWIPSYTKIKISKRRKVKKTYFLYPNYSIMFLSTYDPMIELAIKEHFRKFSFVKHKNSYKPLALTIEELENIYNNVNRLREKVDNPHSDLEIGSYARIVEGPFKDFIGKVEQINGQKFTLLVSVFNRSTRIALDAEQIEIDK